MVSHKAKYSEGLNEFTYCGTLYICHPSIDPASVTASLGITPSRTTRVGDPHRTGANRRYEASHWTCELTTVDGEDIPLFLHRVVELLMPHRVYLEQLSDDNGEMECFIGVFATRLCDQLYPHDLLASLASLRINLRFDLYPGGHEAERSE